MSRTDKSKYRELKTTLKWTLFVLGLLFAYMLVLFLGQVLLGDDNLLTGPGSVRAGGGYSSIFLVLAFWVAVSVIIYRYWKSRRKW